MRLTPYKLHGIILAALLLIAFSSKAQVQTPVSGATIQGVVKSGQTLLPGVSVSATLTDKGVVASTTTDINGQYILRVPGPAHYVVLAGMTELTPEKHDVEVTDNSKPAQADFDLKILPRSIAAAPAARRPQRGRGATPEEAQPDDAATAAEPPLEATPAIAADLSAPPPEMAMPGMTTDAPTESVATFGNTAAPSFNGMFDPQRLADFQNGPPGPGGPGGGPGGRGGPAGGGGGGGGSRGGRGGGGGGAFALGGQRSRQNPNRPTLNFSYTLGDSAFNAAPYSLTGQPAVKEPYVQNRYSATISGPLVIPKIVSSPQRDNYTISYVGSRLSNPYNAISNVPTLLERAGDFSQSTVHGGTLNGAPLQIFNPQTGLPFVNDQLPSIDPAAAGLLAFIPKPNLPGSTQNFQYITSSFTNSDSIDLRLNHTFGPLIQPGQRGQRGQRGGGGGGGRGGGGARGGRGGRSTLSLQFHYQTRDGTQTNPFPTIAGATTGRSLSVPVTYARSFGRVTSSFHAEFSRSRNSTTNLYQGKQDITGNLGILGVSQNPFDWGLPSLSFTNYTGLNDIRPSLSINQTMQIGETLLWSHGKHAVRWGGDYRWIELNTQSNSNSRGTFTFTGAATSAQNAAGTGYDFADFLLGLPQLTSVQFGASSYHFRGTSSDLFLQDDWRVRGHWTLNLGVRYEYWSPYRETNNQIVNLDAAPDFNAVAPVLPGAVGPYGGKFPLGLVNPDRNNFAPRIGFAWRASDKTVVRGGYGINYNTAAYGAIAQKFAFQPPFSTTETNIASAAVPLTLENGFPPPPPSTITNNYGVNKNYRVGYAQMWNLNIQRELPAGIVMNLDYTGTKGTQLDVVEAPNRTATGLRLAGVEPFNWETSGADSTANLGSLLLRRRLHRGLSVGGSYIFSKSLDDASSVGGAAGSIVAQDAFNLRAERGRSTFDQPNKLNADYLWELPVGHNKPLLFGDGVVARVLGDWQLNGTVTLASGSPFTARVLGNASDIERGTNGTLRADVTGLPVHLANSSIAEWFNTAAFTLPSAGAYGNAGRNTIRGPGTHSFNMSLNKAVPMKDTHNLDLRIQATNVFNHPQYASIDSTVNSPTFGRVISAGSMRTIQAIARFRF